MEEIKKEVEEQKIIKIGTKMKMSFVALTHEGLGIAKINGYNNLERIMKTSLFLLWEHYLMKKVMLK